MTLGPKNLLCVAPDQIDKFWPVVEPLIDAAYEKMDEVMPDVRAWLIEARGLLWVLVDNDGIQAACTTSLVARRGGKALRVVACGGSQADWAGCMDAIATYARAEGCYKVVIDGRRGWSRVLPGYDPVCVSFEKRI